MGRFRDLIEKDDPPKKKSKAAAPKASLQVKDRPKADLKTAVRVPGTLSTRAPSHISVPSDPETLAKLNQHAQALAALADLDDQDADLEVGEPELPVTPSNLPAVINREMIHTGGRMAVQWYQVRQLPGYARNAIRQMGKEVFSSFTSTPIEDIFVLSTLTNTETEVRGVAGWIVKNGRSRDNLAMQFQEKLPGYEADVRVFDVGGYQFAIVKDFMGLYIYGYVSKDGRYFDPQTRRYLESYLPVAILCLDCEWIYSGSSVCPKCGSDEQFPLARALNRQLGAVKAMPEPSYQRLRPAVGESVNEGPLWNKVKRLARKAKRRVMGKPARRPALKSTPWGPVPKRRARRESVSTSFRTAIRESMGGDDPTWKPEVNR